MQKVFQILAVTVTIASHPALAGDLHLKPYAFKNSSGHVVQAEWGTFSVPERHDIDDGKTIKLSFVRFKSTNPHPGNPIVYLAGGPGGSGIDTARGPRFALFMALRKVADVIAFDQRGTGASNTIPACSAETPYPVGIPFTRGEFLPYLKAGAKHCAAFWRRQGVDLSAYNTHENATDLESLCEVLGAKRLNLWGISYGTTLALAALKQMPEHIDRVVLASPEGLSQTIKLPARTQKFFERVEALLKTDPKAYKAYPDLLGTMKLVLDKLARQPVKVTIRPSPKARPVTLTLGKFPIQLATQFFAKNPGMLRYLPAFYYGMAAGQFQRVAMLLYAEIYARPLRFDGMSLATDAASGISGARLRRVERQAKTALLGDTLNSPFPYLFGKLGVKDLGPHFRMPVHSDVPALVLTGTLDARTYPEAHAEILKGFSHGTEVIVENAGHNLLMSSPKVTDAIVDFFSHRPVKTRQIELPAPDFVIPRAGGG